MTCSTTCSTRSGTAVAERLDQPLIPRRRLRPAVDADAFGRLAERLARFIGTARFLVAQSMVIVAWVVYNVAVPGPGRFDVYPFIFLTLALSLQAAYAAPLILLAQNRQDDRDRANLVEDRQQAGRSLEDTEFLVRELADVRRALGDVVTRDFLRDALRELSEEIATGPGRSTLVKKKHHRRRDETPGAAGLVTEPQQPGEDHNRNIDPLTIAQP